MSNGIQLNEQQIKVLLAAVEKTLKEPNEMSRFLDSPISFLITVRDELGEQLSDMEILNSIAYLGQFETDLKAKFQTSGTDPVW